MQRGCAKDVFESVFGDGKGTEMLRSLRISRDSSPPLPQVILPLSAVAPMDPLNRLLNQLKPILMLRARRYFYWEGVRLPSWICSGVGRATLRMVIQVVLQESSSGLPSYSPVHGIRVRKGSAG